MSDSKREGVVTLLWDIENINELPSHKIESPVFLSNSLDRTSWKMCLYPKGCDGDADYISLSVTRCGSRRQEIHKLVLNCELSIIDEECSRDTLVSRQISKQGFIKNHTWSPCKAFVSRDDVFTKKSADFIPYNVLHVRCRLSRSFKKPTPTELLVSKSKIERSLFIWQIDNFSCLKDNEAKEIHVRQSATEAPILSYRFFTDRNSDAAHIEIESHKNFEIFIWCEILAIDGTGEQFHTSGGWKFTPNDANPHQFPTFIKISKLLSNKMLYLPMDVLSLRIDSFFWSSKIDNITDLPIRIPNLQICERFPSAENNDSQGKAENFVPKETFDKQSMTENIPTPQKYDKQSMTDIENTKVYHFTPEKPCKKEKCEVNTDTHQNLERFVQDMHRMYEEGLLSDFSLCVGNRTFPVHKNILSARSPVFKAMFTTPLKEKDGKTLDIPDIDAATLHRMLLFVYSNEIADLEWEDALNLYFAADKYNIEDLKKLTRSILKEKLGVSNVCEIMVHADLHEDPELKSSAMDFIVENDQAIIGTDYWIKFQKKYMHLAMEILSVLYTVVRKRKD